MDINRRDIDDVVILDVEGKLTGAPDDERFHRLFDKIVSDGGRKVIINLADVHWIDSTGLGIIIRGRRVLQEAGGHLVLMNVGEGTRQVFSATKLDSVLSIFDSEAEALDSFKETA